MTQTITLPDTRTVTAAGSPCTGLLMGVVVSLLAPAFLGVTGGDAALAGMAAAETIGDYRARNRIDLIAVAQIVTNGLAALGSLGQSMNGELSVSMALRLRANAISLNRTVERNRLILRVNRDADPVPLYAGHPEPEEPEEAPPDESEVFLNDAAAQFLAAEAAARLEHPCERPAAAPPAETAPTATAPATEEKQIRHRQARMMIKEAGDISATLHTLPPLERAAAEIRVADLGIAVRELITGERLPSSVQTGGGAAMFGTG